MQTRTPNWLFNTNFNFNVDSVFTALNVEQGIPVPPSSSLIITEDGSPIVDESGLNFIITE